MFDMDFKVKDKSDVFSISVLVSYLVIMGALVLFGMFGTAGSDAMGYSLLAYYVMLPVLSLIVAMMLGNRRHPVKWIAPVLFAGVGYVMPIPVFGTTECFTALMAFVPALVGFVIGTASFAIRNRTK